MLFAQVDLSAGQIITTIITLSGAGVMGWLAFRSAVRDKLVTSLQADVNNLTGRLAAVEAEKNAMRKAHETEMEEVRSVCKKQDIKINAMTQRMMYIESEQGHSPFPEWEMDEDGCYVACNEPFVDRFLRPLGKEREDAIGKGHAEVFNNTVITGQLNELNAAAKGSSNGMAAAHGVRFRDGWPLFVVAKGVLKLGRRKVGMRGMAISENDFIALRTPNPPAVNTSGDSDKKAP